jgi:transcriptional regulator with XRE-family HTH domain
MNVYQFKRIRERLGITQAELARQLGVSRAAVSRWERGVRGIDSVLAFAMNCLADRNTRRHHGRGKK